MSSQATKLTHTPDALGTGAEESRSFHEQVAIMAYHLWQERGCPEGSPEIDWLEAEQELQPTAEPRG
jgi:hypothetical protein